MMRTFIQPVLGLVDRNNPVVGVILGDDLAAKTGATTGVEVDWAWCLLNDGIDGGKGLVLMRRDGAPVGFVRVLLDTVNEFIGVPRLGAFYAIINLFLHGG
jgi:hypothetical protein